MKTAEQIQDMVARVESVTGSERRYEITVWQDGQQPDGADAWIVDVSVGGSSHTLAVEDTQPAAERMAAAVRADAATWDADPSLVLYQRAAQRAACVRGAAAILGSKGGQARGPSKARPVTSEQMRAVRSARPKPQVYEHDGEWGGYTVREGLHGWTVEGWSRVQGERTGWRYLVAYDALGEPWGALERGQLRLDEPINDYTIGAELILERAKCGQYGTLVRVLRRGHIVE